jgi:hypothetical protein
MLSFALGCEDTAAPVEANQTPDTGAAPSLEVTNDDLDRPTPQTDATSPHDFVFSDTDVRFVGRVAFEVSAWQDESGTTGYGLLLRSNFYSTLTQGDSFNGGHQCRMNAEEARAFCAGETVSTCQGEVTGITYLTDEREGSREQIMAVDGISLVELAQDNLALRFDLTRAPGVEWGSESSVLEVTGPVAISCAVVAAPDDSSVTAEEPLRDTMWESEACLNAAVELGLTEYIGTTRSSTTDR